MSVVKRVDVIPKAGKEPLFCIFVIVLDAVLPCAVFPPLRAKDTGAAETLQRGRVSTGVSIRGETVETLLIREADGGHSDEYAALLTFLCKPSSKDREIY